MRSVPFIVAALVLAAPAIAQVTPGKWDIVTTINSVDMPGAPPFIANMMKGKPIKISHCLTAEEAARGPQEMMKSRKECRFTRYSMAGGKLDSVMVCEQGSNVTTATSTGSFTSTGFTSNARSVTTGNQPMTMTMTAVGTRTGDCK